MDRVGTSFLADGSAAFSLADDSNKARYSPSLPRGPPSHLTQNISGRERAAGDRMRGQLHPGVGQTSSVRIYRSVVGLTVVRLKGKAHPSLQHVGTYTFTNNIHDHCRC